jgi:hypothetical protein
VSQLNTTNVDTHTRPQDSLGANTFMEFWRHYLCDHGQTGTRTLHFFGNGLAVAGLILGLIMLDPIVPIVGIAIGYLMSWSGHILVEHNRPSMLTNPIWSFICDVRMLRLWLGGRLAQERDSCRKFDI